MVYIYMESIISQINNLIDNFTIRINVESMIPCYILTIISNKLKIIKPLPLYNVLNYYNKYEIYNHLIFLLYRALLEKDLFQMASNIFGNNFNILYNNLNNISEFSHQLNRTGVKNIKPCPEDPLYRSLFICNNKCFKPDVFTCDVQTIPLLCREIVLYYMQEIYIYQFYKDISYKLKHLYTKMKNIANVHEKNLLYAEYNKLRNYYIIG